jgi:hypothetical protein
MRKSGDKGASFERQVAKELSLWWTHGARDDVFWRTNASGGRARIRKDQRGLGTFGQYGDLQATDPLGQPLLDLLSIEVKKGYNRESAFQALDKRPRGGRMSQCQWEKFLDQTRADARDAGSRFWMLIHKRDARACMVYLPSLLLRHLPRLSLCSPHATIRTPGRCRVFCTTFEEFQRRVLPGHVRTVAHPIKAKRC